MINNYHDGHFKNFNRPLQHRTLNDALIKYDYFGGYSLTGNWCVHYNPALSLPSRPRRWLIGFWQANNFVMIKLLTRLLQLMLQFKETEFFLSVYSRSNQSGDATSGMSFCRSLMFFNNQHL